jgi:hypothetical protein
MTECITKMLLRFVTQILSALVSGAALAEKNRHAATSRHHVCSKAPRHT